MTAPAHSFAYVLTIVAGPTFGGRAWQLASNRPPTTTRLDEVAIIRLKHSSHPRAR
jgi:hypothetical protein